MSNGTLREEAIDFVKITVTFNVKYNSCCTNKKIEIIICIFNCSHVIIIITVTYITKVVLSITILSPFTSLASYSTAKPIFFSYLNIQQRTSVMPYAK